MNNVIFLDFDGVLVTIHASSNEDIENKIKILSDICHTYNCSVVVSSSHKDAISDDLKTDVTWIKYIFNMFNKYNIKCIGKTPTVKRNISDNIVIPIWKEDEIRLYLYNNLYIDHYVIIDDDDYQDLKKVENHLVRTISYSKIVEEEGLLASHKDEVGEVLKLDNDIKKLVLRHKLISKH